MSPGRTGCKQQAVCQPQQTSWARRPRHTSRRSLCGAAARMSCMVCAEPARAAQAAAPSSPQRLATCRSSQDTDINSRCAAVPNKPAPPRPRGCCGGPLLVVRHPTRPCQQGAISRSWISDKPDAAVLHKGVLSTCQATSSTANASPTGPQPLLVCSAHTLHQFEMRQRRRGGDSAGAIPAAGDAQTQTTNAGRGQDDGSPLLKLVLLFAGCTAVKLLLIPA